MSNPITELSGAHIGRRITVTQYQGTEATGILFSVSHTAAVVGAEVRRSVTTVNIGGNADITLGPTATYNVHDGKS